MPREIGAFKTKHTACDVKERGTGKGEIPGVASGAKRVKNRKQESYIRKTDHLFAQHLCLASVNEGGKPLYYLTFTVSL